MYGQPPTKMTSIDLVHKMIGHTTNTTLKAPSVDWESEGVFKAFNMSEASEGKNDTFKFADL